jgi:hypothetical protein
MLATVLQNTIDSDTGLSAGFWIGYTIFVLVALAIGIIAMWKVFNKANQSGWPSIIPILNNCMVAHVAGREWWWGLLLLVPCVGFVVWIILMIDLAKSFGHGIGFALGLILLPIVFWLILAFGSSTYQLQRDKWI